MEKVKNIATITLFALTIFGFLLALFVIKTKNNRIRAAKTTAVSEISAETVFSRTFFR